MGVTSSSASLPSPRGDVSAAATLVQLGGAPAARAAALALKACVATARPRAARASARAPLKAGLKATRLSDAASARPKSKAARDLLHGRAQTAAAGLSKVEPACAVAATRRAARTVSLALLTPRAARFHQS